MASCLIYVRISELTDATTSPERQRADCAAYAERMGWDVVGTFEDLDISGTKGLTGRPGLRAALDAIDRGEASYLVAARIDRLARSVITFHEVVQYLQARGAALVSVAEGLDFGTAAGRMVANVLATFAQFESETIGSRVKAAKAHLTASGKWPGGRRPFGWTPVPHESGKGYRLALHPEESDTLRDVVALILDGTPPGTVAGLLNRQGITTALGKEWVGETVRKAVTKPAMIGRHGADPLVDEETYARLQRLLGRGRAHRRLQPHDDALLPPDLIYCGRCNVAMRPATDSEGRRVYRCSSRPAPGVGGCFMVAAVRHVDKVVEDRVLAAVGRFAAVTVPEDEVVDPAAEERASIVQRMRDLEQDRYIRGLFSGDEGAARFETIYRSLEDLLADLPPPTTVAASADASLPTGKDFAAAWEDATVEVRRAWLERILDHVAVAPGRGGRSFDRGRVSVFLADGAEVTD